MGSEDAESICSPNEMDPGSINIDNELGYAAENLTRVELDLACCSEKLVNLDILVLHLASRENDFEAFVHGEELNYDVHKALQFDFLYVFLDCEIQELERFLCSLQNEIVSSSEEISSFEHAGDAVKEMEDKIRVCEDLLKRSFKQVLDIKEQCAYFKRILCSSPESEELGKDESEPSGVENGDLPKSNEKIKMQTAEQQRNILRMLEKSLAREMDLEKKLIESRQTEEDIKSRVQREVYHMEQEVEDLSERLFYLENSKEVVLGILRELQEKVSEAETRAENAESESRILQEINSGLNNDLNQLKVKLPDVTGKLEQLEKQLKITEDQRLHALAAAEAVLEIQTISDCTIKDMESLIEDLKSKVSRAETQTESAEEKCILLSETNAELTEVISHLRRRVEALETSSYQAETAKQQNVKDISMQTKLIADLIVNLAVERERLQTEVLSLRKEKKVGTKSLQQQIKDPSFHGIERHDADGESRQEQQVVDVPVSSSAEIDTDYGDSAVKVDAVRNIDARQLNFKHIIRVVLVLGIPLFLLHVLVSSKISSP